ncbi:helix-turn-helix domain-containing protein [Nocardia cyriacigeorgica]|uniref:helix-turn-helix domain-containing protein n=1 Tax=Nocardia cyriacigeorgica TaxID=135487 RepID=UPI0018948AA3|nr:helix-turn-helix domain-containing protein [Nocardia cyriacigeorgica]MBF6326751.1 helix-turn-helix domain-containing protein [Nocardia cyriacigeorgica]
MTADLGDRVASVRKRRGLSQQELARVSGISLSLIKKLEQGARNDVRLETLRALAVALRVRTSVLQNGHRDTEWADDETADLWGPVRRALAGQADPLDEQPTVEGVQSAYDGLRPALGAHRYRDVAEQLPALLRDADALDDHEGRAIRSRILGMTGWLLVQNRQFDTAKEALDSAIDQAPDRGTAVAAVNALVWSHLRQGNLTEAAELAQRWADDIEPKFSRATGMQLALWGRLWLYIANVGVRDNSPGMTDDALALARAAADRIGREVVYDPSPHRPFGPVTVAQITGECAVIAGQPERVLSIAEAIPASAVLSPTAAPRLRHRLDVAAAHAALRQFGEAMATMQDLYTTAPEWLPQQRYARDILGTIVRERRTLTEDMRTLADAIKLEY